MIPGGSYGTLPMIGRLAQHTAGAVAAWLVCVAEGLVSYLALVALALVTGTGLGGPLAGPLMVLAAALLGAVLVPLVVAPAVVIGDAALARHGALGRTLAAGGVAALLVGLYAAGIAAATGVAAADAALAGPVVMVAVLCPVAAYAAVVHGSRAASWWLARWRRTGSPTTLPEPAAAPVDRPPRP